MDRINVTNDTHAANDEFHHHQVDHAKIETVLLPKIIILLVLSVFIVLANGTLIVTIVTHKYLRKKSNYFVIALACADFVLGMISVPLHIMGETGVIARSVVHNHGRDRRHSQVSGAHQLRNRRHS